MTKLNQTYLKSQKSIQEIFILKLNLSLIILKILKILNPNSYLSKRVQNQRRKVETEVAGSPEFVSDLPRLVGVPPSPENVHRNKRTDNNQGRKGN